MANRAVPEQVIKYLESGDIEMVRLGVVLLANYVPLKEQTVFVGAAQRKQDIVTWVWAIDDKRIVIRELRRGKGLWEQLQSRHLRTYTINTGVGGMKLLTDAMKSIFNQQNK